MPIIFSGIVTFGGWALVAGEYKQKVLILEKKAEASETKLTVVDDRFTGLWRSVAETREKVSAQEAIIPELRFAVKELQGDVKQILYAVKDK